MQGQEPEGIAQMRQSVHVVRSAGANLVIPHYLAFLAEAYGTTGQIEEGLTTLADAFAVVDKTDERHCEAELYRLKGELLLQQSSDNQTTAETCVGGKRSG